MKNLVWSQQLSLNIPAIDDAHKAFVEGLARFTASSDREFGTDLFALIADIERDFREEEAMMEEIDFPGLHHHREQHARILSALHEVVPEVMHGNYTSALKTIELLPRWFLLHLSTMDAALAVALQCADLKTHQ
ncbi:MAG: bacteriohemerythrin [Burkholderiaceae bacterium]